MSWPKSCEAWATALFDVIRINSIDKAFGKTVQEEIFALVQETTKNGTLWTRNWDEEPPVPTAAKLLIAQGLYVPHSQSVTASSRSRSVTGERLDISDEQLNMLLDQVDAERLQQDKLYNEVLDQVDAELARRQQQQEQQQQQQNNSNPGCPSMQFIEQHRLEEQKRIKRPRSDETFQVSSKISSYSSLPTKLSKCLICLENKTDKTGAWGQNTLKHFCCGTCLQDHVISTADNAAKMAANNGLVPCVSSGAGGCTSTWQLDDIIEKLEKETCIKLYEAVKKAAFDTPRQKKEIEIERALAESAVKEKGLRITEKIRRLRNVIVERDLTLHCPRCSQAFLDFQGCCALHCKDSCGAAFCGLCLLDCGSNAHPHFYTIHKDINIFDIDAFKKAKRERSIVQLVSSLKKVKKEETDEVFRLLIEELGKVDLDDLFITMDDLRYEINKCERSPEEIKIAQQQHEAATLKQQLDNETRMREEVVLELERAKERENAYIAQIQIRDREERERREREKGQKRRRVELERVPPVAELPKNARDLVVLTTLENVKQDSREVARIAEAISRLAGTKAGRQSCIAAHCPAALTSLARLHHVMNNTSTTRLVAKALLTIAASKAGKKACYDVGALNALSAMARVPTVANDKDALRFVQLAIRAIGNRE